MYKGITIGVMQGRLLPPVDGRLQAFPGTDWEKEFALAKECGLDAIEMIYDVDEIELNPLHSDAGLERIKELKKRNHIKVISVCADYFIKKGFIRVSKREREENIKALEGLTIRCQKISVKYVVIPLVDQSEVKLPQELEQVRDSLVKAIERTKGCSIIYALEMSLPAEEIAIFVEEINSDRIKVNYDTGNSTFLGYDLYEEIVRLGPHIVDVHIKDRKVGGGSCIIGQGDTDFDRAFEALARTGFGPLFILQAQRGGDETALIKKYVSFLKIKMDKFHI
jgi:L-ribulose-5-phosphate 3-epimerase